MRAIIIRIVLIISISLFCGILINTFNPNGIQVKTLLKATQSIGQPFFEISADSAFVFFLQEQGQFIDMRPKREFNVEHLPHAISKPFKKNYQTFDPSLYSETNIILYGNESDSHKLHFLSRLIVTENGPSIYILKGGILSWMSLELPLEMRMDP